MAGNTVGGAGAGGEQGHADFAGGPGIAVCGMDGSLLVTDKDMLNIRIEQFVIQINDRAARKTENNADTFFLQALDDRLCTCHFSH